MAQDEGWAIGKEKFELSVPDLGIQEVYARSVDPDQNIIVLQFRFSHVGKAQSAILFVPINDERFHDFFLLVFAMAT